MSQALSATTGSGHLSSNMLPQKLTIVSFEFVRRCSKVCCQDILSNACCTHIRCTHARCCCTGSKHSLPTLIVLVCPFEGFLSSFCLHVKSQQMSLSTLHFEASTCDSQVVSVCCIHFPFVNLVPERCIQLILDVEVSVGLVLAGLTD